VVADQLESERKKTQTRPEIRETFIRWLRIIVVLMMAVLGNSGSTPAVLQNCRF
jgi:hypothetical protein